MSESHRKFVPKSKLAQSNFHHKVIGSSQRNEPNTPENTHRPAHEFLSDEELNAWVQEEIANAREMLTYFRDAEDSAEKARRERGFLTIRDKFLFPNLYYLVGIGRLPEGISVSSLKEELSPVDLG